MGAMQKNPKIASYLQDQELMSKFKLLMQMQKDPAGMQNNEQLLGSMMKDQRLLELMMAMQGIDMPAGGDFASAQAAAEEERFAERNRKDDERRKREAKEREAKKAKMEEMKRDERTEESKLADQLKDEGNALYKAKKFEEAIAKYDEAIRTQPNDLMYLLSYVLCFMFTY